MFGMPSSTNGAASSLHVGAAYSSDPSAPTYPGLAAPAMGLPSPTAAAALYATGSTFGALPGVQVSLDPFGQATAAAVDPYTAAAFAQGAAYAAAGGPGRFVGVPPGLLAPSGSDEIRTIFISGFPTDVRERELHNMLRMMPGFEACQMNWKAGVPQGFALFATAGHARQMVEMLSGMQFDDECTLRAEMAHKNMFLKDDPTVKRATRISPLGIPTLAAVTSPLQSPTGAAFLAPLPSPGMLFSPGPLRPASYSPVTNHRDNPPCNTLFIGNLGDAVSEVELRALFSTQPGYKQLKLVRTARATTAFVEFTDVQSAMMVHETLQGAVLNSSDRGGVRVQYSKNPYGKREPTTGGMGLFNAGPGSHGSAEGVAALLGPPHIMPPTGNGGLGPQE